MDLLGFLHLWDFKPIRARSGTLNRLLYAFHSLHAFTSEDDRIVIDEFSYGIEFRLETRCVLFLGVVSTALTLYIKLPFLCHNTWP